MAGEIASGALIHIHGLDIPPTGDSSHCTVYFHYTIKATNAIIMHVHNIAIHAASNSYTSYFHIKILQSNFTLANSLLFVM